MNKKQEEYILFREKYKIINFFYLVFAIFKKYFHLITACDIPLKFFFKIKYRHPVGVVITPRAKIGKNVVIFSNVNIGRKSILSSQLESPTIKDNVVIYTGVSIIGGVTIGENSVIGANTLVLKDVPSNSVAVGNPMRLLKKVN